MNGKSINRLLEADFTPVFCAITHDKKGQLLNTNADSIASRVAAAMSSYYSTKLILCFEKEGVLSDPEDDAQIYLATGGQRGQPVLRSPSIVPPCRSAWGTPTEALEERAEFRSRSTSSRQFGWLGDPAGP